MKKLLMIIFLSSTFVFGTCDDSQKNKMVLIKTNLGDIKIRLYDDTPAHRDNFIKLAEEGFYDSLLFHRVILNFMIQAGDPDSKGAKKGEPLGQGGPGYTLPAEIHPHLFHKRGAVAAARMGDNVNPERRSSGSQFYIVQGKKFTEEELQDLEKKRGLTIPEEHRKIYTTEGGVPHLDNAYTVFGEVVEGMDVVDQIAAANTDRRDRPVENIIMEVEIIQ